MSFHVNRTDWKKTLLVFSMLLVAAAVNIQAQTVGVIQHDYSCYEGYTLLAPSPSTTTYLIDNFGRVVHSWESLYAPALSCYLLENGNLLRTIKFTPNGAGFEEVAWDGTILWHYEHFGDNYRRHHDIEPMPDGGVLVLSKETFDAAECIANGRDPSSMINDELSSEYVVEVQQSGPTTGDIVWEWHLWDHLIQDFDSTKANYGIVENHPELFDINYPLEAGSDWIHANAVAYNPILDQIVISNRNFSEFWVIDHSTSSVEAAGHSGGSSGMGGDILYRWGNPITYRAGTVDDQRLYGQHDVHWIESGSPSEGHFLLFNNGLDRPLSKHSSVEEITPPVDSNGNYPLPAPGEAHGPEAQSWIYEGDPPTSMYSPSISGAQRLPNGNTLICVGRKGTVIEVDSQENVVWKYINPDTDTGVLEQGQTVPSGSNSVFKCRRYSPDYPGLAGRDLTPGNPIEIYSIAIGETSHFPQSPSGSDSVTVISTITDDIPITTAELYVDTGSGFIALVMYDDGNHGDSLAGDDIFGAVIPPVQAPATVSYYIHAENEPGSATTDPTIAPSAAYRYSVEMPPYVCGDANGSFDVDIDDAVFLISYIFAAGPAPAPYASGDANCSGDVDIDDAVYLIAYIFSAGNPPCDTDGDGSPDC